MGKIHKRYNWKSRQIVKTVIDETEQKKIRVELDDESGHYDASNALVLPSKKRRTKKLKDKNTAPVKLLSKKQRIKLKKITEKKLKNSKREALIEELQRVQATPKELEMMTSLQTIQTLGRKKYLSSSFNVTTSLIKQKECTKEEMAGLLKWKTPKAVKREMKAKESKPKRGKRDYNIVQSESSSSSEDESEIEETDSKLKEPSVDEIEDKEGIAQGTCLEPQTIHIDCDQQDDSENDKGNAEDVMECTSKDKKASSVVNKNNKEKISKICNENKSLENNENKCTNEELEIVEEDIQVCEIKKNKQNLNDKSENVTKKQLRKLKAAKLKHMFKLVQRDPEIQKERLKLPILSEEHAVMEAINENPIVIVVGPTGSGKTTQVPQFLYEAGYTRMGMIGVTEPRRIAAISMADRVGLELNLPPSKVSYQIRYEGNTTKETEIKFMTDGVLFQELRSNRYLEDYSAIIIDEVHERSVHSDILLGLLSRIVPKRNEKGKPLKLIIMSATPRIEDFTQNPCLFNENIPPVIQIPSRHYSVTAHFSIHTKADYCEAAYKMVCRIHKEEPTGGILVFLTGQQEINELCEKLREKFPDHRRKGNEEDEGFWKRLGDKKERRNKHLSKKLDLPEVNLKDYAKKKSESKDKDDDQVQDAEIFSEEISAELFTESGEPLPPLWILPLYSLLPSHEQKKVFEPPPEGARLCVVSTNVAETSLTIPNIKYVVDSGKTKEKVYDPVTGISSFRISWTSKASATQRAGRAGRTTDGVCFRLYSSAVYNDEFLEYALPDIQRRPLDDVVLIMKALKVPVYSFPYPTPPDMQHLGESFKRLTVLGALKENPKLLGLHKKNRGQQIDTTVITKTGRSMSHLPMAPRFAKMILNCNEHREIFPYVIILIAALTVREIIIDIPIRSKDGVHNDIHQRWKNKRLKWSGKGQAHLLGDLLVLMNAVLEAEQNNFSYQWCYDFGLRHSALMEYRKLRRQLTNDLNLLINEANIPISPNLKSPTDQQAYLLAEIIFIGSKDQVARRVDINDIPMNDRNQWKNAYRALYTDKPVFVSSASSLWEERPKYIMYQQIYDSTKVYLRGVTVVNEAWMIRHGSLLVDLSPPLDDPKPKFNSDMDMVLCHRSGTYGPNKWPLQPIEVEFPLSVELFKWVAYFFLMGEIWVPLLCFVKYLHDPVTLISPIALRFREKRENLIRAFASREIRSRKCLHEIWRSEPNFLKQEYFAWFDNQEKLEMLSRIWPPIKEDDFMFIKDERW